MWEVTLLRSFLRQFQTPGRKESRRTYYVNVETRKSLTLLEGSQPTAEIQHAGCISVRRDLNILKG